MKAFCLTVLYVIGLGIIANGQLHIPGMENFKKVMSNCIMDYTMKCEYPGGEVYDIKGKMAVKGNSFYDSSNLRYVFRNEDWYIIADHTDKIVSVAYISDINKELDGIASVTSADFLFGDDMFERILKIDVQNQNADTSWTEIKFKDSSVIEQLKIQTLRKNLQPVSYKAIVNYPVGGYEDGEVVSIRLSINCYNISAPVPDGLFDDKRLVSVNGKVAKLKQFNSYKTYK